jgi:hypothetical protein
LARLVWNRLPTAATDVCRLFKCRLAIEQLCSECYQHANGPARPDRRRVRRVSGGALRRCSGAPSIATVGLAWIQGWGSWACFPRQVRRSCTRAHLLSQRALTTFSRSQLALCEKLQVANTDAPGRNLCGTASIEPRTRRSGARTALEYKALSGSLWLALFTLGCEKRVSHSSS